MTIKAALAAVMLGAAACGASQPTGSEPASPPEARSDLYQCDGCEAVHEQAGRLSWQVRMAPPGEPGEPLVVRGTVYQTDGVTPAPNVIVYAHQANARGLYEGGSPQSEWSRRHGRIRAWAQTGADGRYEFQTIKPAPYPTRTDPAHVHLMILEPNRRPYYIDEIVFAGEFGVDREYRRTRQNRGGTGIVPIARSAEGEWIANRDIILEVHPR